MVQNRHVSLLNKDGRSARLLPTFAIHPSPCALPHYYCKRMAVGSIMAVAVAVPWQSVGGSWNMHNVGSN